RCACATEPRQATGPRIAGCAGFFSAGLAAARWRLPFPSGTGLAGAVRHGASPGSGRVDVAQRTDQPARALVGTRLRRTVAVALGARLFALRLAPGARGLVFDIQRLRHRGRAARIRQPGDLDLEELASPLHAQGVAHAHRARSLGPLAAELDLAGVDGLPGQRARPEEARGPQPQIEADR